MLHTWIATPGSIVGVTRGAPMDAHEIVVHGVERNGRRVVLDLLAEGVRPAGKSPHRHPNREVLALDWLEW